MHIHWHFFHRDILSKGVARNYDTKPNKKAHGPLRKAYLQLTNFKNVEPQLSFDAILQQDLADEQNYGTGIAKACNRTFHHVVLGAQQPEALSFGNLETLHADDPAFSRFWVKFAKYLNEFLPANSLPLPGNKYLRLDAASSVIEYRYIKIDYESSVMWRTVTDRLRCSPQFFGNPRYDCVMYNAGDMAIKFGRLIFVFTFDLEDVEYLFALIHPYNAPTGVLRRKDKHLGLVRVRARSRVDSTFIPIRSIIRGACLVPTFSDKGKYHVVDNIDADMFLHLPNYYPWLKRNML
ncbi:hypothetical protein DXG03_008070 [Asterophora parasitica]|uniref:Uncharacterized protein n=1 Tax=Asterophora parasitica TaxID=117018 RepID=A0A9P7G1Y1_9AGAR|nr:hypothetical protein DXG03_008070 [Asterophora parasitica]